MSVNRNDSDGEFLTVAEVAEVLKLNQQTVRNWIDQGSLPAVRVGRRVRIKRSDFDRVLAEGYSATPAASQDEGPSAEDFWGGEPVGLAEPGPARGKPGAGAQTKLAEGESTNGQ
jgi:excisionase family DNA binding protein